MIRYKRNLCVQLLGIFLITIVSTSETAYAIPSTAREWIDTAVRSAQRWQADAKLVQITTLEALGNGKAERWSYEFYSESSENGCKVEIRDGWVGPNDEGIPPSTNEIPTEFIDSTLAMKSAKKQGRNFTGTVKMTLRFMKVANSTEGIYWLISDPDSDLEAISIKASEK